MDLANKNVLIIGKGISGINCALFVKDNGGNPYIYDDFDYSSCEIKQISYTEVIRQLPRFDFGILSPGVSLDNRLVRTLKKNNFLLISELDFAYLESNTKIIAVTGTNGKTTTVRLTTELLSNAGYRAVAVGNIGVPFVIWCKWLGKRDVAVVEVSSFQLEHSDCFMADIATITNITADHLDRHKTLANYKQIKQKVFRQLKEVAVVNLDNEDYYNLPKQFTYSLTDQTADIFVSNNTICYNCKGLVIPIIDINLLKVRGEHNIYNVLSALSLAICHTGRYLDSFAETLKEFALEKYRIECLGSVCGVEVYNDSKGTNMGATLCAVKAMQGDTLLIMGGYDKQDDYKMFFEKLDSKVVKINLCGANTVAVLNGAINAGKQDLIEVYDNLASAVDAAFDYKGYKNLLFSPATSSFDMYYDYKQRGRAFEELVNQKRKPH